MSENIRLIYSNSDTQLDHLHERLQLSACNRLRFVLEKPGIRKAPNTATGQEFEKFHPGRFPRYSPGQIIVEDETTNARVYIQGRINPNSEKAKFMISYGMSEKRIALLKKVLFILLSEENTWMSIVVNGKTLMASGPDWKRQADAHPDWRWGYGFEEPGFPFLEKVKR